MKTDAYPMVHAGCRMEDMGYAIRWWIHFMSKIWKKYFNLLQTTTMKKIEEIDIRDVDWQTECQKGNYLVGNDQEGYRYAVHYIVDETEPLYHDEWEAWQWLYDHLVNINADISFLPSYNELRWD